MNIPITPNEIIYYYNTLPTEGKIFYILSFIVGLYLTFKLYQLTTFRTQKMVK